MLPEIDYGDGVTINSLGIRTNLTVIGNIYAKSNINVSGNVTATDFYIPAMKGNNNYSSVNDFFRLFTSAGRISGGEIVQNGTNLAVIVTA